MKFSNLSKEKRSFIFLFAILLVITGVSLYTFLTLRVDPVEESIKHQTIIKTLLVVNDGNGNALSTDVYFCNPQTEHGALFEIKGNTGSIYKSLNKVTRIDEIYKELGVLVYRDEIAKLLDEEINFTIEISLDNLGILTDYLGGLTVFIPTPIDEVSPTGERWLLPGGRIALDGDKLKTYENLVLPDEKNSKIEERRQNVIVALISAFNNKHSQIFSGKNFQPYADKFKANIEQDNLEKLLKKILKVNADQLTPNIITGTEREIDGQRLLFPEWEGQLIKDLVARSVRNLLNEDMNYENRDLIISVLNGTQESGKAKRAADLLKGAKFEILNIDNADSTEYEETVIINHTGNPQAAKILGDFINCNNIIDEKYNEDEYTNVAKEDLTLILGRNFNGRRCR